MNLEKNPKLKVHEIRYNFIGWQCRLRQIAMREAKGQPSSGMCPKCFSTDGRYLGQIVVLLVRKKPVHDVSQLKHIFLTTQDPFIRYQNALRHLSAGYYQSPQEFSHEITALFDTSMMLPTTLISSGGCILEFSQYSATYRLRASIRRLETSELFYQFTYWHNSCFNQKMPETIQVLSFSLDWESCQIKNAY